MKRLWLVIVGMCLSACVLSGPQKMQRRDPASFAPEHELSTFWLQCHLEAKIEKVDAPVIGPDVEGHMSGGPYCKVQKGQCVLTEGSSTVEYPRDVTCNVKPTGDCPSTAECVHAFTEPSRKQQDWERNRQPSRFQ